MSVRGKRIVSLLVGTPPNWPTGAERITTLRDALRWRVAALPWLDAGVSDDGRVTVFFVPGIFRCASADAYYFSRHGRGRYLVAEDIWLTFGAVAVPIERALRWWEGLFE